MSGAARKILKRLLPARWRRWCRLQFGWRWLRGDYRDWAAARAASLGYDVAAERERYRAAARLVQNGAAAWERDGTTFATPAVNTRLLQNFRRMAGESNGSLDVVDFGGAFGSTWRQNRAALAALASPVTWRVVEQPDWVRVGRAEFANEELQFHESLADAVAQARRPTLLLSSVLQYLEQPHRLLAEAAALGFRDVIIDRTPFWRGPRDRLAVQHTPPELGGGTYPCWVFNRAGLLAPFAADYAIVAEWEADDDLATWVNFRGCHLVRQRRD